jgi:nucleoside-diphosphate-sugar epimerase
MEIAEQLSCEDLLELGALPVPAGEPPSLTADTTRLSAIGWQAHYNLRDGLRQTIDWWRTTIAKTQAENDVASDRST